MLPISRLPDRRAIMARVAHLPERKRQDIERIVRIIRVCVAAHAEARPTGIRHGISRIVLTGPHARRDWREEHERYFSDYEIVVIVDHPAFAAPSPIWAVVRDALLAELGRRCAVNLTVSTSREAEQAQSAQTAILQRLTDGIVLYEASRSCRPTFRPIPS